VIAVVTVMTSVVAVPTVSVIVLVGFVTVLAAFVTVVAVVVVAVVVVRVRVVLVVTVVTTRYWWRIVELLCTEELVLGNEALLALAESFEITPTKAKQITRHNKVVPALFNDPTHPFWQL
jgi:hypothetical protein